MKTDAVILCTKVKMIPLFFMCVEWFWYLKEHIHIHIYNVNGISSLIKRQSKEIHEFLELYGVSSANVSNDAHSYPPSLIKTQSEAIIVLYRVSSANLSNGVHILFFTYQVSVPFWNLTGLRDIAMHVQIFLFLHSLKSKHVWCQKEAKKTKHTRLNENHLNSL